MYCDKRQEDKRDARGWETIRVTCERSDGRMEKAGHHGSQGICFGKKWWSTLVGCIRRVCHPPNCGESGSIRRAMMVWMRQKPGCTGLTSARKLSQQR